MKIWPIQNATPPKSWWTIISPWCLVLVTHTHCISVFFQDGLTICHRTQNPPHDCATAVDRNGMVDRNGPWKHTKQERNKNRSKLLSQCYILGNSDLWQKGIVFSKAIKQYLWKSSFSKHIGQLFTYPGSLTNNKQPGRLLEIVA